MNQIVWNTHRQTNRGVVMGFTGLQQPAGQGTAPPPPVIPPHRGGGNAAIFAFLSMRDTKVSP